MARQPSVPKAVIPPRVALYCRVSSEDQAERKTIENQRDFLTRYAALHGLLVADVFADDGISGTVPLPRRPEGQRLLDAARSGDFRSVVFYRLDRLGRSLTVLLDAYSALDAAGVAMVSATEPFDTTSSIGRFIFQLLGSIAELEKETILERMTLGRDRGARTGKWMGGPVPYGYEVAPDGRLIESTESIAVFDGRPVSEADVVRRIFDELAAGSSTVATAALLNTLNVPAHYKYQQRSGQTTRRKGDNLWRPNKVRNIVANPIYAGRHVFRGQGGESIERDYPPLVSREVWERANDRMRRNRVLATRNAHRTYLLRGLIRCGNCQVGYAGTPSTKTASGWVGYYYRCNSQLGALHPGKTERCRAKRVPADWLEGTIWEEVADFLTKRSETLERARQTLLDRQPAGDPERLITEIETGLRANAAARERILELYRRGRISLDDLDSQLSAIEQEESILRENLAAAEVEAQQVDATAAYLENLDTVLRVASEKLEAIREDLASGDPERVARAMAAQRDLIELLVERIVVTTTGDRPPKDAKVSVTYRFRSAVVLSMNRRERSHGTD